jgi:RibD C-terminal domain
MSRRKPVNDGVENALKRAKAAAGDKNVTVMGGANTAQQYIAAGLLDEMRIHLVPLLLGEGARLFDNLGARQIELETLGIIDSPGVTHMRLTWPESVALHLMGKCEHVGEEARVEKHRGIDPLRLGIGLGHVEAGRERAETDLEYRN